MAGRIRRQLVRCSLAMAWAMGAGILRAADTDGESSFDGAFLSLSSDIVHDHMALRSFAVTPHTSAAFINACSHGRHIWINNQAITCLHAEAVENGSAIQLEIAQDAIRSAPVGYYLVSAKPTRNAALRALKEPERDTMSEDAAAAAGVHITAAELGRAKAADGKDRTLVFVAHGKDHDGNRSTDIFSVAGGQVTYTGKLPDWPENLMDISGALQAIVNLHGEARIIQAFSTWPRVEAQMFAGEGG
ncbi:hypothetical protein ACFWZ3_15685 [Frateuria sp. GZRR35]|uniref:hypothetical protein n=1 Tax=Frateuria sp. GZRR35 TaxID=3351536 RepID=UPI003EDB7F92